MLVDLLKKSEFGSLTKVELSSELIDNFLWELSLVNLDVLDVLTAVELHLKDANWLFFILSLFTEIVELFSCWALLNLWSIVASVSSSGGWWLLVTLVGLCGHLGVLSEGVGWVLLILGRRSGAHLVWSTHISVSIDHLLRSID